MNDKKAGSFTEVLLEHLSLALYEVEALADQNELDDFALYMGVTASSLDSTLVDKAGILASTLMDRLITFDFNTAESSDYINLLEAAVEVIDALDKLSHASASISDNIAQRALGYFVNRYLQRHMQLVDASMLLLGVLDGPVPPTEESEIDEVSTAGDESNHISTSVVLPRTFHPELFMLMLRDPADWAEKVYQWKSEFDVEKLLKRIGYFARVLGIGAPFFNVPESMQTWLGVSDEDAKEMRIPLLRFGSLGLDEAGIALSPMKTIDDKNALLLTFYVTGLDESSLILYQGTEFDVCLKSKSVLPTGISFILEPGHYPTVTFAPGIEGEDTDLDSLGIELVQREPIERLWVGGPTGMRIGVRQCAFSGGFCGDPRENNLFFELKLSQLFIGLDCKKLDGFLGRIFPLNVESEFEIIVGWSAIKNFYFGGSGALDVTIPIHRQFGPISLNEAQVTIGIESDHAVLPTLTASFGFKLGPISGSVERIGLAGEITFARDTRQPQFSGLQFRPPVGAGLSVCAGPIVGGGFLEFYDPEKRYAGILQLQAGGIGLVAIGLITTRMPDGSDGFSLLVNIGVQFMPPIQLPYGFTLSGVGGLLGYNRTMNTEALREGLRNRALDSILFPEDPIKNAAKIISDLRTVFPPEEGRFVVGPMVKLGWGTPKNIIDADIGIFIELPMPVRIALLGQIAAGLPLPENAIIELHIDVLGIIEFDKQLLSIDATIYDSRIYEYTLTGDAAVRLAWGDTPVLAMSLGGFHPAFIPPPGFPSLERLTLNLSQGPDLQLYCKAYQALTSNSLQFGALVALYAKQSGAVVEGNLSFDTLIYFSPFSFTAVLAGNVLAKYKGHELANVHINMQLAGPTPWNAQGSASFEILFWDLTVKFNKSWGPVEQIVIEAVDPWGEPGGLKEALEQNESWGARLPGRSGMVEMLATQEKGSPTNLVVHPAGVLEVRQRAVPLKMTLEKFGNAPVKDHSYFEISSITVAGQTLPLVDLEEPFARAQFLNLTESERLSLPSFEEMPAGVAGGSDAIEFDSSKVTYKKHEFESILIQEDRTSQKAKDKNKATLSWRTASQQLRGCSARRCGLRTSGRRKFETLGKAKHVSAIKGGYKVVDTDNLSAVAEIPKNDGTMRRIQAEQALAAYRAAHPAMASRLGLMPAYEVAI
jgi:hypothetical protein